jgi:hypothetical protein
MMNIAAFVGHAIVIGVCAMTIPPGIPIDRACLEAAGDAASCRLSSEACRTGGEIVWFGELGVSQDVSFR